MLQTGSSDPSSSGFTDISTTDTGLYHLIEPEDDDEDDKVDETTPMSAKDMDSDEEERGRFAFIQENYQALKECKAPKRRELIFLAIIVVLSFIAIGCFYAMCLVKAEVEESNKPPYRPNNCYLPFCLRKSSHMLDMMDIDVNPCDNFYRYACGGFVNNTVLPLSRSTWDIDDDMIYKLNENIRKIMHKPVEESRDYTNSAEKKVKKFYMSCMDLEAIDSMGATPIVDIIQKLGGWALTDGWKENEWNFDKVLTDLHFKYWAEVFFSTYAVADNKTAQQAAILFDQQGLGLPDRSDYLNTNNSIITYYKQFMRDIGHIFNGTESKIEDFIEKTFNFEHDLAKIFVSNNDPSRHMSNQMNNMLDLSELTELAPAINWESFLVSQFKGIKSTSKVVVKDKNYIKNLSNLIAITPKQTLNYYMIWRLVQEFAPELSKPFRRAHEKFEMSRKGTKKAEKRHEFCKKNVDTWMGMAVGAIFIKEYFPESSRNKVNEMIKSIKTILRQRIGNITWMDDTTQQKALAKLDAMKYRIGYPDFLTNDTKVDEFYSDLVINEADSYFQNLLNVLKYDLIKMTKLYDNVVDEEQWGPNPHEVNAFYSPAENLIIFPAGILQSPYFDEKLPMYLNFGAIGSTIGHEMIHGFDTFGSKYDRDGNVEDWWSEESALMFENRTACLANFYSSLKIHDTSIDGNNTLDENMADVAGLLQAFYAFSEWEKVNEVDSQLMPGLDPNPKKLLFLSYAQNWCQKIDKDHLQDVIKNSNHAPSEIRVLGAVQQLTEFTETFECKEEDPMLNPNVCSVW